MWADVVLDIGIYGGLLLLFAGIVFEVCLSWHERRQANDQPKKTSASA